ncbi:DUF397 domain-containing protein [Streptomyces smyrnaeus]|uniref:DUF397 domain-containing protein n=1 Tax=Streptomyces TaxID=1883 RepID=UPI001617967A|nr:DUF397 domain-containing protein [Streptomyces sp. RK75]MBQ0863219.1 DUF397 domain-containing protein [Streptomyces sp. RK75]MBQ1157258.1 DUF397 domain-containing protein [Streptomyces sp. A73]
MNDAPTITTLFRKSSYSGGDHSECVEVAHTSDNGRAVRDSKDTARGTTYFAPGAWQAFITYLNRSEAP